jgi:hypothetical protein
MMCRHLRRSRVLKILDVFSECASGFFEPAASHPPQLLRLVTKDYSDRLLAQIIHECRCVSFEPDARRGFSQGARRDE